MEDIPTLKSIRKHGWDVEIIIIDNRENRRFANAAAALNHGGARASGKYIFFAHQDLDFTDPHFIGKAVRILDTLPDVGVAGIAGARRHPQRQGVQWLNRIRHGVPPRPWGEEIGTTEPVQTLDECLLIVPRNVFATIRFDERVCDGWHLYGVDLCLSCKAAGLGIYVLPLPLYHHSDGVSARNRGKFLPGTTDPEYFRLFEKVRKKHKDRFDYIYTTSSSFPTNINIFWRRVLRRIERIFR